MANRTAVDVDQAEALRLQMARVEDERAGGPSAGGDPIRPSFVTPGTMCAVSVFFFFFQTLGIL